MTSKSTPSLNEAITRRTKRSTAGIKSRYNQTPSSSPKTIQKSSGKSSKSSKSTPLNVNAKIFSSKSICTSGNKSAKEVQILLLEEIKQLESRLEKQISQDTDNELNANTNSTLDFSIVRENPPAVAKPPLSVPLNQGCETPKRDYRNAVKNSIAVSISPQVNTDVNNYVGSNVNDKNNSYPLQPSVKPKTNRNGKSNLLVIGDAI